MPGPVIPNPTPDWLKPENASVTDTALTKAMRMIGHLIGADNPTAQVLGLMMTDVPGGSATGGLAKAVEGLKARVIKAYHGSPHDFERFSLEKIGTGEGAQAYGHGLYFAEKEQTAKTYRDTLAGRIPGGYSKPDDALVHASTDFRNHGYTKEQAIPELKKAYPWAGDQHLEDAWHASNQGKMYEVAIHADPEDFLDWDKPLSQQSEKVKQKIAQAVPHARESLVTIGDKPFYEWAQLHPSASSTEVSAHQVAKAKFTSALKQTQGDVEGAITKVRSGITDMATEPYKKAVDGLERGLRTVKDEVHIEPSGIDWRMTGAQLARAKNLTPEEAAQSLRAAGLPGIKYLDQGSRNPNLVDDRLHNLVEQHGGNVEAAVDQMMKSVYDTPSAKAKMRQSLISSYQPPTRNYVVFDDKLIDILKKYGLLLPAAGGVGQATISRRSE